MVESPPGDVVVVFVIITVVLTPPPSLPHTPPPHPPSPLPSPPTHMVTPYPHTPPSSLEEGWEEKQKKKDPLPQKGNTPPVTSLLLLPHHLHTFVHKGLLLPPSLPPRWREKRGEGKREKKQEERNLAVVCTLLPEPVLVSRPPSLQLPLLPSLPPSLPSGIPLV